MKKRFKVLIVDDHPMIVEGYKNALLGIDSDRYKLTITTANSCDSAYEKIVDVIDNKPYDVIFFDVKLPPSADGKILSGEDLGVKTRALLPATKIVILTMFNDGFRIQNIIKNVNPDGFLIKSDITSDELVRAFEIITKDPPYYSHTVSKLIRKKMSSNIVLDEIDRSILYHLSKGIKTKNLPNYIKLSLAAIEKRKKHLRDVFEINIGGDKSLLEKAQDLGYL